MKNDRAVRCGAALGTLVCAFGASVPALALSSQYYVPPKLVKQGTAQSPIAGNGTVIVQVLVNTDGSFKVQKIVRSSNHGDDQAALEMAATAKYSPATKGGRKIQAFYTYTLKFVGSSATLSDSTTSGQLATYNAQVRAGRYADAKTGLSTYLMAHPSDTQASMLLGVADTFLEDYPGAAAAFDKAGTIPSQYRTVAARAYAGAAEKAIAGKDSANAVSDAKHANELSPGVPTLNLLGNAQLIAGDFSGAAQSFEQARAQAQSDSKVDSKQRATILANLASAYAGAGDVDKATALIPEIKQLDPANTNAETAVVATYARQASAAQKAGNIAQAAALYDKAAGFGPQYAATMYTYEAFALLGGAKPDYKAAKAAADKALAVKPDSPEANYAAGLALANSGNTKDAIPFLQKADAAAKAAGDTALATRVESDLKKINGGK